ncbi:glycosyltransferase family 2 protein [Candidatus Altiarchaeota archaeon]
MKLPSMFHNKIKASVVVPTYNRLGMLQECLQSLEEQSLHKKDFEVIVVDDGSKDATPRFLEEWGSRDRKRHRYFAQKNMGVASARNNGIKAAKGEIVCFLDDDCIATEKWLEKIMEGFVDEKIGGVGGDIVSHKSDSLLEQYAEETGLLRQSRFIELFIVTANAAYLRKILREINGFDEEFLVGQDVELGLRVRRAGYKLSYKPEAVVFHKHRATFLGLLKQGYSHGVGYAMFNQKYEKHFSMGRIAYIIVRGILRDLVFYPFKIVKFLVMKRESIVLVKPLLDVTMLAMQAYGVIHQSYFKEKYKGKKISERLDFIDKAKVPLGWGK